MSLLKEFFGIKTETQVIPEPEKLTFKQLVAKLKAENIALTAKHKESGHLGSALYIELRSKHIAYCLLRGRTMEQIENKNRVHIVKRLKEYIFLGQTSWIEEDEIIQNGLTVTCHQKAKKLLEEYQEQIQE